MSNQKSKVVKITFPYDYANEFIEESRISWYDSRALNVIYKHKMFNGVYQLLQTGDRKYVDEAKEDIKQLCKELYLGMDKFYKEFYMKNK